MGLSPIITSDVTKSRTIDLLKNLRHKIENDFMVCIDDVECVECSTLLTIDTPIKYVSEDLKTIDGILQELIDRQERLEK